MKKKKQQPDDKLKVPGYIVTYSDMVTLLLTFFVMLLSLSTTRDPELFNVGRDSFIESIRGYGLGTMFGKKQAMERGSVQNKHTIDKPEDTDQTRTIDATEERTRRAFEQVDQLAKTMSSEVVGEKVDLPAVEIAFAPSSATLDKHSKKSIKNLCSNLMRHPEKDSIKLYVLGMSSDSRADRDKWTLSAQRAEVVSQFIAKSLPHKIPIFSWGAGPGEGWTGPKSSISKTRQIVISALR